MLTPSRVTHTQCRRAQIKEELESATAASRTLQAMPAFSVRAEIEQGTALLMVDVVGEEDDDEEKEEEKDGDGGLGRTVARQRLAVNAAFERRFLALDELLAQSLHRKTCPLLLLAA